MRNGSLRTWKEVTRVSRMWVYFHGLSIGLSMLSRRLLPLISHLVVLRQLLSRLLLPLISHFALVVQRQLLSRLKRSLVPHFAVVVRRQSAHPQGS